MTEEEREQAERGLARKLFNAPAPVPYEDLAGPGGRTVPTEGNYVPREGTGGAPPRPRDYDERDFVGELFGTPLNMRNLSRDPAEPPYMRTIHLYPSAS